MELPGLKHMQLKGFVEAKRSPYWTEPLLGQALGIQEVPLGLRVYSGGSGALRVWGRSPSAFRSQDPRE